MYLLKIIAAVSMIVLLIICSVYAGHRLSYSYIIRRKLYFDDDGIGFAIYLLFVFAIPILIPVVIDYFIVSKFL